MKTILQPVNGQSGQQVTEDTPSILSTDQYRLFWIHHTGTKITFGKGQLDEQPVLTSDVESMVMKSVSLTTSGGTTALWRADRSSGVYLI